MGDLTLQDIVLRIVALLLISSVHGFTVAATACALGDAGPRHDARLTLNPLRHADLLGGLLAVLFTFGWIRPIALDADRWWIGRAGSVVVVFGASCATLCLAMLLQLVRPAVLNLLPDTASSTFFVLVATVGQLCVSFTLFNLLPLPPLTGQHLLLVLLPWKHDVLRRIGPYVAVLLALSIATGVVRWLLAPIEATVARVILTG